MDPKHRRIVVSSIPKDLSPAQVSSEITSALVALFPQPFTGTNFVTHVQFLMLTSSGRSAMVEFTSPDVASLVLTLSGPFTFRRPRDFEATTNDSQEELINRVLLATATRADATVAFDVTFPASFPESVLRDLLGQFGSLKSLSLEKIGSAFSGRGVVEFENFVDGLVAVVTMAAVTKDVVLSLSTTVAEAATTAAADVAAAATGATMSSGVDAVQFPISAKILCNPLFARQLQFAREIGARASVVVVLLNVFPDATGATGDDAKLLDEVTDVAVRQGSVAEVRVEMKKVFVRFLELSGARKFQAAMNGRVVDGLRVICAGFYPIERFTAAKFSLFS